MCGTVGKVAQRVDEGGRVAEAGCTDVQEVVYFMTSPEEPGCPETEDPRSDDRDSHLSIQSHSFSFKGADPGPAVRESTLLAASNMQVCTIFVK